jgi:hypothetical protein
MNDLVDSSNALAGAAIAAAAAPSDPADQYAYNYIFQKLVSDENDLVGIVAYSIYKRQKIQWLEKFKNNNRGAEPTTEQLRVFNDISHTNIQGYKSQAEGILNDYMQGAVNEFAKEVVQKLNDDYEGRLHRLDELIEKGANQILTQHDGHVSDELAKHHKFWPGVVEHVVASAIVIFAAGLLLVALSAYFKGGRIDKAKDALLADTPAEAKKVPPRDDRP